MSWRPVSAGDEQRLVEFLCRDEASCAAASSRVKAGERGCTTYVDETGGAIRGALVATTAGLVLPVLPEGTGDRFGLAALLGGLRMPVHSIGGPAASVGVAVCKPSGAPGRPTVVRPLRIGYWPVIKDARPAVQEGCA